MYDVAAGIREGCINKDWACAANWAAATTDSTERNRYRMNPAIQMLSRMADCSDLVII
jgi:hypothetical protein